MPTKRDSILDAALNLFGEQGFHAVSTKSIATEAGVSEGLIFTHFKNKQGLLDAIMEMAADRLAALFGPLLFETDALAVIRKLIELPYELPEDELSFWKVQVKLKWELELFDDESKMKPILEKLTQAFTELDYQHLEREAQSLCYITLEGVAQAILRGDRHSVERLRPFLLEKYGCG